MTIDDAYATPVVMLRPSSARPRAAIVVRFPGDPLIPEATLRELVLRGLLQRGWSLVSAPSGEFEFPHESPTAWVQLSDGDDQVTIEAGGQVLYAGPLLLSTDIAGHSWAALARAVREVLVFAATGPTPVGTSTDIDAIARAGHLVGLRGLLT